MSITVSEAGAADVREWLLLLFFLPARRAQARVQAWRRLQRVGAVSLKNAAYVLPHSSESREDFEWIRSEIVAAGGQAMVLAAQTLEASTVDEIVHTFRSARGADFQALATAAAALMKKIPAKRNNPGRRDLTQQLRRLRERFDETVRRDFFDAPERQKVEAVLTLLEQRIGRRPMMAHAQAPAAAPEYRGKVWLTRPRPGVDRMSSAWLIRRFIDPAATFVFTDPAKMPEAIPFDTFKAEFGHHGPHCTFETLCDRFALTDPAVLHIGRIVHDLDLKDTTHGEPETTTIGHLVDGLRRAHHDDEVLLRAGIDLFEALYQSLATPKVESGVRRRKRLPAKAR